MARKTRTDAEILATSGLDVNEMLKNILATFDRATASEIVEGATWYGTDSLALFSNMITASGGRMTLDQCAAVTSQLSPQTKWARNVAGSMAFAAAIGRQDGTEWESTRQAVYLTANVDRAVMSFNSPDPLRSINANKTKRFALNLMGETEPVTVDIWAARIAFGEMTDDYAKVLARTGIYAATEKVYQIAAGMRGVDPCVMQATTWCVIRGKAN